LTVEKSGSLPAFFLLRAIPDPTAAHLTVEKSGSLPTFSIVGASICIHNSRNRRSNGRIRINANDPDPDCSNF
jgi:hypothetical protein